MADRKALIDLIEMAIFDPSVYVLRLDGDDPNEREPVHRWEARAVLAALESIAEVRMYCRAAASFSAQSPACSAHACVATAGHDHSGGWHRCRCAAMWRTGGAGG